MLSLLRTLSGRYLWRRRVRAVLIVLSIALGVATLVATQTLNRSMAAAARGAVTPLPGLADLIVTNGEAGVPLTLADELRRASVPGLNTVRPLVLQRVALPGLKNRWALLVGAEVGADADTAAALGLEFQTTRGLFPLPRGYPVFVSAPLAADMADGISEFSVRVGGQSKQLSGFGVVHIHDSRAAALGGNVLFMRLADALQVVGSKDKVSRIDLGLEPGARREDVLRQAAAVVGDRATVRTLEANNDSLNDVMQGLKLGFTLGGVCALVVGLFLVYNALSVNVAERRHDIGILRSLGATRPQIGLLFTAEALLLGLIGSLLALPVGLGMARLALQPFQKTLSDIFLPLEASEIDVGTDTLIAAVVAGLVTTLLAALVPAIHAAAEEPADAVRRSPRGRAWLGRLLHVAASAVLIGGGFGCIALRHQLPHQLGTFGGLSIVLVGMLVATPLLAAVAARLFRPVARLFLPIEVRLAADNLTRSPGRTGLVIAALAASVALIVQTAGVTASSETEILDWVDRSIGADLFLTSNSPVTASSQNIPMPASLGPELEALPEVNRVVAVRFRRADFRDKIVYLIGLDASKFNDAERLHMPQAGLLLFPKLREPNTALISENFASQHRVGVGDTISLRGPHGPVELRVIGTVLDYSWNRGTIYMDWEQYRQRFDDPLVDVYDIYVEPGQEPEAVRAALMRKWGVEQSLVVLTRDELRNNIRGMVQRLYGISYAQEVVVGMVAALGVVTALLISVLQRRRELGLLRAVGASRGQVLRSVLAEATLMGVIGSAIGLLFGAMLEWYAVRVLLPEEAGFTFPLHFPWAAAGIVVGVTLLLATLAGLMPALQAVRLRIADAIAYE